MAEIATPTYKIRYAAEHDVPEILRMVQELASYERSLHEVLATEDKLFNTLAFPTSSDAKIREKGGFAKTLLIIPESAATTASLGQGGGTVAREASGALETETSTEAGPTASSPAAATKSKEAIAGMALYFNNYSTWLAKPGIYLEDLFVRPAYRKRGFGLALLQALARECVQKDYGRLEWSVLKWNKPSIDFYESEAVGAVSTRDEWEGMRVTGEALVKLARSGTR